MNATSRHLLTLAAALLVASAFSLPANALWGHKDKDAEKAGAVLFRDKGCAHCHGADRAGTKKAPSLVNIRKNKLWTPDKMAGQILNGGKKMPPFSDSLSDQELAQVIAYLRSKHPPVPPPLTTAAAN
ncbi:MAG TPA: cytochrome c [Terracidiphilus sp.]|nr:cytochrome c [Terracidiphilus sp.]